MWRNDDYVYTSGILKGIATSYHHIYQRIEWYTKARSEPIVINDPQALVEYKADFDMALNEIGRGTWSGEKADLRNYGRLQGVVVADIYEIEDDYLEALGYYDITKFRGMAYSFMARFLNGGDIHRPNSK